LFGIQNLHRDSVRPIPCLVYSPVDSPVKYSTTTGQYRKLFGDMFMSLRPPLLLGKIHMYLNNFSDALAQFQDHAYLHTSDEDIIYIWYYIKPCEQWF
jgi:hypothetical protein